MPLQWPKWLRPMWAFVHDQPNPLTPASGGRSERVGHAVGVAVTCNGSRSQSIAGLGCRKCRCFGMSPRFVARTVLMTSATPAAGSRCPMLVLTEPMSKGRSWLRPRPQAVVAVGAVFGAVIGRE